MKTFEELATEKFNQIHKPRTIYSVITDFSVPLMKLVREETIKEIEAKICNHDFDFSYIDRNSLDI